GAREDGELSPLDGEGHIADRVDQGLLAPVGLGDVAQLTDDRAHGTPQKFPRIHRVMVASGSSPERSACRGPPGVGTVSWRSSWRGATSPPSPQVATWSGADGPTSSQPVGRVRTGGTTNPLPSRRFCRPMTLTLTSGMNVACALSIR